MTLTLTIASLRKARACELDARIVDLRRVVPDVAEDTEVPLRTWWDLPTTSHADDHRTPWDVPGQWHWRLADVERVEGQPSVKGQLGLWDWQPDGEVSRG